MGSRLIPNPGPDPGVLLRVDSSFGDTCPTSLVLLFLVEADSFIDGCVSSPTLLSGSTIVNLLIVFCHKNGSCGKRLGSYRRSSDLRKERVMLVCVTNCKIVILI